NILDCPSFSDWSSLLDTIATEPFFHQPAIEETPKPDLQEAYPLPVEDVLQTPTYKVLDLGHVESPVKTVTPKPQTSQWQALARRFNLQPRIILIILGVLGLLVVSFSAGGWLLANRASTPNPNLSYVTGHVEDSSSNSLDNASVTITVILVNSGESETQSKRTDNEGNFQIGFNLEGEATAEISISGYGYQFTPTNRNVNLSHSNIRPFGNFQMLK
ncbi:carboxypeptidase regulatory-like domain-containing protein, partial [bacterium]|nr:carboxypeptidase regulatory-like domain-containing protein [bacterium]